MASMTMTDAFLPSSASTIITKLPSPNTRKGGLIVAKASSEKTSLEFKNEVVIDKEESSKGRRNLVFAAAACSIAKVAMADEPKPGTLEAKKKYAPVCVTMPTARICKK